MGKKFFRIDIPKDGKITTVKKKIKCSSNDIEKLTIKERSGIKFILLEQNTSNIKPVEDVLFSLFGDRYNMFEYKKLNHIISNDNYPVLSRKIPLRDAVALPCFNFKETYTLFFPKEKNNSVERRMSYKFTGNKILFDDKSRFFYNKNNELLCLEDMLISLDEIYKKRTSEYPEYIPYRKVTVTAVECFAYICVFERIKNLVERINEGETIEKDDTWRCEGYACLDFIPFLKLITSDRDFPSKGDKERDSFGIMSDGLTEDCISLRVLKNVYTLIYWQILSNNFLSNL